MSRGQRSSVNEDPSTWVLETYPWSQPASTPLLRLKPECTDSNDRSNHAHTTSNGSLPAASANSDDHLVSELFSLRVAFC